MSAARLKEIAAHVGALNTDTVSVTAQLDLRGIAFRAVDYDANLQEFLMFGYADFDQLQSLQPLLDRVTGLRDNVRDKAALKTDWLEKHGGKRR